MISAARQAVGNAPTKLLAVTVLTSLNAEALHDIGVAGGPRQQVLRLARLAIAAGAHGLVCSAQEVAMLREALGPDALLVVPGIRPAGSAADDQARTMTPREAAAAGADWLVIGRPITAAADPAAAAATIAAELVG
jgi:orotidine-5'-phosphate decarboxylase